jgi:hypothetical protein
MVGMTGLVLASTYVKYAFQNLFCFYTAQEAPVRARFRASPSPLRNKKKEFGIDLRMRVNAERIPSIPTSPCLTPLAPAPAVKESP